MSEGLDSQINIGDVESFITNEKIKRKVCKTKKFNKNMYLDAVNKINNLSDIDIARKLKVNRTTVWRFRTNPDNQDIILKAKELLNKKIMENKDNVYSSKIDNWEYFKNIKIISEWERGLRRSLVSRKKINDYMRGFWYVCKHLKRHPNKLTVDECAMLIDDIKILYYCGESMPKNLAYSRIRESIRSFYTRMHKMSGEYISSLGITKETLKGCGKYARQKIPRNVRKNLKETLLNYTNSDMEYLEALYIDKFMYYTGTRITATLLFNFNERQYELDKDVWMFEVLDKGKTGGKKWEKYLIGYALDDFKIYCSKRFGLPIDQLETELPMKTNYLFPSFIKKRGNEIVAKVERIRGINKNALIEAG